MSNPLCKLEQGVNPTGSKSPHCFYRCLFSLSKRCLDASEEVVDLHSEDTSWAASL